MATGGIKQLKVSVEKFQGEGEVEGSSGEKENRGRVYLHPSPSCELQLVMGFSPICPPTDLTR